MRKIVAIAQKPKLGTSFHFEHPEQVLPQLEKMKGTLKITIELLEDKRTERQFAKLEFMLQTIRNIFLENGENLTERETELYMIKEIGGFRKVQFIEDMTLYEARELILRSDKFIQQNQKTKND
jgi:hypothetical protein